MKKHPRISVLMPVYNSEQYLKEAIQSILDQTYPDFEFIIVDDGSTDKTAQIIQEFAKTDKRIKYLYKKNGGVANALNFGWEHAKGEFIARMDGDDISFPKRFEKQIKFLDDNPSISIVGTWFNIFPQNEVIKNPTTPTILSMLCGCAIHHPTIMLRKADFDKYAFRYNSQYHREDYELWSRAIRVLKFANIPEVLLDYRWNGQNICVKKADEMEKETAVITQSILDYLTTYPETQKYIKDVACKATVRYYLFGFIPLLKIRQNKNKKKYYLFNVLRIWKVVY